MGVETTRENLQDEVVRKYFMKNNRGRKLWFMCVIIWENYAEEFLSREGVYIFGANLEYWFEGLVEGRNFFVFVVECFKVLGKMFSPN